MWGQTGCAVQTAATGQVYVASRRAVALGGIALPKLRGCLQQQCWGPLPCQLRFVESNARRWGACVPGIACAMAMLQRLFAAARCAACLHDPSAQLCIDSCPSRLHPARHAHTRAPSISPPLSPTHLSRTRPSPPRCHSAQVRLTTGAKLLALEGAAFSVAWLTDPRAEMREALVRVIGYLLLGVALPLGAMAAMEVCSRCAFVQQEDLDVGRLGSWPQILNRYLALQWWLNRQLAWRPSRGDLLRVPPTWLAGALLAVCLGLAAGVYANMHGS